VREEAGALPRLETVAELGGNIDHRVGWKDRCMVAEGIVGILAQTSAQIRTQL
jgi:hypothetical protein